MSRGIPQADQFYSRDFNESVFQWAFQGAIRTMQGPLFPEARDASGALGSHCVLYVTYGQKGLNLILITSRKWCLLGRYLGRRNPLHEIGVALYMLVVFTHAQM